MAPDPPTPDAADGPDPFAAILVEILEAEEQSGPVDPADWYARYPEYRAELEQFFADASSLTRARDRAQESPAPAFPGYDVIGELGRGGNGVVFEATELTTGRVVALKALIGARLLTPVERVRFRREAKVAALLDHPHVLPVYDAGEADGTPYYTMMLATGGPLSRVLNRFQADPKAAAALVARLARGVHFAHQRGVLHRDLKPSNILLDGDGNGYVSDFGLVRDLADPDPVTGARELVGTIPYMAPESIASRGAWTVAVDVYGLGGVLYACLSGRPPFEGKSDADTLIKVRSDPPTPPAHLNPQVPRDLDAICRMCLEKNPAARYASAAELADDLDRFGRGEPVRAKPIGMARRAGRWVRRNPVVFAFAVALAGLAVGLGVVLEDRRVAGVLHESQSRAAAAELAEAEERAAAGKFVDILEQVRRRRTDLEPSWPAENLADLRTLADLPVAAGRQAVLRTEAAAALGGVDLGLPKVVAEGFDAYNPAFSPDGKTLALGSWRADDAGKCSVRLLDAVTGAVRETLSYPTDPEWEKRYSTVKQTDRKNIDGCRSLTFSPDGRWLVLGTRSGWLWRWDLRGKSRGGVRWRHAAALEDPLQVNVRQVAFTPSGAVLVSSDGRRTIFWNVRDRWSAVCHHVNTPAVLIRPARPTDPLYVHVGSILYAVPDKPPWVIIHQSPFYGGLSAAAPNAELLISQIGTQCRPFAPRPGRRAEPDEYMDGFTGPNDGRSEDAEMSDMAVNPNGRYLASSSELIGHLKLWSVATRQLLSARTIPGGSLRFAFTPDGHTLAVCDQSRTLLFEIASPAMTHVALQPYPLHDAAVTPKTTAVLAGDVIDAPLVHSFDTTDQSGWGGARILLDRDPPPDVPIQSGPPGGNNRRTVAVSPDGGCHAYTVKDAVYHNPAKGPGAARAVKNLRDMAFTTDSRLWLAADQIIGWTPGGPDIRIALAGTDPTFPPQPVCLAVSQDTVLAGRTDGALSLVDSATGVLRRTIPVFDTPLTGLGIRDDIAVAGSALGPVKVVRLASAVTVLDLPNAHRDVVTAVAVGPGGWFATGSRDRAVKVWSAAGELVFTLAQTRPVKRLFWAPDGQILTIAVEGDRGLRRWDLAALKTGFEKLGLRPDLP
jgi:eukaryotic-like serine/threonine-protein kinase